jgi:hypothetical protein
MNPKTPFHCLVWIDHRQARIYAVSRHDLVELALVRAPDTGNGHIHHHAGTVGPGHEPASPEFLRVVVEALKEPGELLIVGPGDAKHALKRHIAAKFPSLDRRILGVETLPKAGDHDLQAFSQRFFHRADRMQPM